MIRKLILSLSTLLLLVHISDSQQVSVIEPSHFIDSELLKTARRQKTFSWIMIGLTAPVTGILTYYSELNRKPWEPQLFVPERVLGALTVVGGVILVTAGIKNMKRALSVGLKS